MVTLDERAIFSTTIATKITGGSTSISFGEHDTVANEEAAGELLDRIGTGPLSVKVVSFEPGQAPEVPQR